PAKRVGEATAALVELPIAKAALAIDDGKLVGIDRGGAGQKAERRQRREIRGIAREMRRIVRLPSHGGILMEVPPEINAEDSFHRALRLRPAANLDAAIGENDPARRLVILVAGYFEAPQAGFAGHRQYQRQSPGRIAAPALPRHDRIADMARNVVGNIIAASHVAEIDRAAEVAVIEPEH